MYLYQFFFQFQRAMSASKDSPREFAGIVATHINETHLCKAEKLGINLADKMLSSGNFVFCLPIFISFTCIWKLTGCYSDTLNDFKEN